MADKKLLRKIAPIIMSAAVAMTSSPSWSNGRRFYFW